MSGAPEGLMTAPSRHGPVETLTRLEASVAAHGFAIFARIDHAEGAKGAGMDLRPQAAMAAIAANAGGSP